MSRWKTSPADSQGALFPYPPEFFYIIGPISLLHFWSSADEHFAQAIALPFVYAMMWVVCMLLDFPSSIWIFVTRILVMLAFCGIIAIKWIWFLNPR